MADDGGARRGTGRAGRSPGRWPRRLAWALVGVAVLAALLLFLSVAGPPDPVLEAPEAAASSEVTSPPATPTSADLPGCDGPDRASLIPFPGFGEVPFRVVGVDGEPAFDGCAHLAATPATRARGLMGQRSLGGYDGMVFRFDGPSTGGFYMFRTVLPLSIAFVAADGSVVSAADMEPCAATDSSACPSTFAAGPYVHAIEVEQGGLERLGVVPGATVEVGAGAPPS